MRYSNHQAGSAHVCMLQLHGILLWLDAGKMVSAPGAELQTPFLHGSTVAVQETSLSTRDLTVEMFALGLGETSCWTCLSIGALTAALVAYLYYSYVYEPMQYFQRVGLPGPKPHFLLGNVPLLGQFKGKYTDFHKHLGETYGNVCGYFVLTNPEVLVADPDMIKQISIKDFDKFPDRQIFMSFGGIQVEGKRYNGLLLQMGQQWKKSRNILTPAFTASKMKLMEPLMRKSTLKLVEKLKQIADTEQSIDVLEYYNKMTMEVILATAFGRSLEVQDGQGGEVYEGAKSIFRAFESGRPGISQYLLLLGRLKFLAPLLRILIRQSPAGEGNKILTTSVLKLLESRKSEAKTTRVDLLQLMIDANRTSDSALEDGAIAAQAVGFLLAGYETTSNAVTFMSYLLALHPDVQERLANEIHSYLQDHPDESIYDAAPSLEYLDMVFQETLRLYPPGAVIVRYCTEDCEVGGVQFKKGFRVNIPVYYIHRRADLWPEPETFDPERFTAEEKVNRHPYAYVPFGVGPRSCIGMRFAIMEAKMAMIDILENFRIVRSPDTQVPLELKVGITMSAKNGAFMRFESRHWE